MRPAESPPPGLVDDALLTGRHLHDACRRLVEATPVGTPERQAAERMLAELEGLAGALTGDRQLWRPRRRR